MLFYAFVVADKASSRNICMLWLYEMIKIVLSLSFLSESYIFQQTYTFCCLNTTMGTNASMLRRNRCFLEFFRWGKSFFGFSTSKLNFFALKPSSLSESGIFVIFITLWHQRGINACQKSMFPGIFWLGNIDFRIQYLKISIFALKPASLSKRGKFFRDFRTILASKGHQCMPEIDVSWNFLAWEHWFSDSASQK